MMTEHGNGKFRDECLNERWLLTRPDTQRMIEAWRRQYNKERTHSSIGNVTPMGTAKAGTDDTFLADGSSAIGRFNGADLRAQFFSVEIGYRW